MFENIQTIIFDLDGTLYQDDNYHKYYLHNLLENTGREDWESSFIDFVESVLKGEHLKMNAFYLSDKLETDDLSHYFCQLEESLVEDVSYHQALKSSNLIYLGDLWAVLNLLGKTSGMLEVKNGYEVFKATRKDMEAYATKGDEKLLDALLQAKEQYQTMLFSNTDEFLGSSYLTILGFQEAFTHIVYQADKPRDFLLNLEKLDPDIIKKPESILSIGDHGYNDLMPLQSIGGRTVWINPYKGINEPTYDLQLNSINELTMFLNKLLSN